MLQTTKCQELETFRNLPATVSGTMTRFHFQLHIDMHQNDYLVPPKPSVQAKFKSSIIGVELEVLNYNIIRTINSVVHHKKND